MQIVTKFICWFIFIYIDIAVAIVASNIAAAKGYSQGKWFLACFLLPGISYILLVALPNKELHRQNEEMIELQKQLLIAITGANYAPADTNGPAAVADVPNPFTEYPSDYPYREREHINHTYTQQEKQFPVSEEPGKRRRHFAAHDN